MALHNNVFKQQIWEFFKNDMESCFEASRLCQLKNIKFPGGVNFIATLTVFCIIEMLAAYYKGKTYNKSKKKDRLLPATDNDVAEFLSEYFSKYNTLFSDKENAKCFYRIFRHGLVHQFSPKACGISMDFSYEGILVAISTNGENILCLVLPAFYKLTLNAIKDYETNLDTVPELRKKFEKRYSEIIKRDYEEMRFLRNRLINFINSDL